MRLLSYKYNDVYENGWDFSKVSFGKINLLVGNTGSGKTRFLNTLFNIGKSIANPINDLSLGHWEIDLKIRNVQYSWMIEVIYSDTSKKNIVSREKLIRKDNTDSIVIDRGIDEFLFLGKKMPKLNPGQSALTILSDEEIIHPITVGFSSILRRHFSMDALFSIMQYGSLPEEYFKTNGQISVEQIAEGNFPLNLNLYLLSVYFPNYFKEICSYYKSTFPFIEKIDIKDMQEINKFISLPNPIPVFCIQEKGNPDWIELRELSSGMLKVLLILTDFYILPDGGIYLLDEYENSLGPNAIDFLPSFLLEQDDNHQYIITSHHPYLISTIPTKNWFIFHREKKKVDILFGQTVVEKYGKSKQDSFSQLMNDPYYLEGVK